jgi:hypothetical protein
MREAGKINRTVISKRKEEGTKMKKKINLRKRKYKIR